MSEEKDRIQDDRLSDHWDKIIELETKIDNYNKKAWIPQGHRIEKLEKTFKESKGITTIVTHGTDHIEIDKKLSELRILASAKAVIVPEGKSILWTDKIEKLEAFKKNHMGNAETRERFAELEKELSELKASSASHTEDILYHKKCIWDWLMKTSENREVLRELFKRFEKANSTTTFYTKQLESLDGVASQKESAEGLSKQLRVNRIKHTENDSIKSMNQNPKPPSCTIVGCNKVAVYYDKNGWEFCKEHSDNPSEQDEFYPPDEDPLTVDKELLREIEKEPTSEFVISHWKCPKCGTLGLFRNAEFIEGNYIVVEKADLERIIHPHTWWSYRNEFKKKYLVEDK